MIKHISLNSNRVYFDNIELDIPNITNIETYASGCNGVVFKAKDYLLDRTIALKVWDMKVSKEIYNRALNETKKLAKTASIFFVTVHRFGYYKNVPYAVLEYIPGITLRKWLDGNRSFYDRAALWEMYIKALKYLYDNNMLHGDPHAKNVIVFDDISHNYQKITDLIVDNYFGIKLTDFGTSYFLGHKNFELREANIIKEVACEIYKNECPQNIIEYEASNDLNFVISVFDSFQNYCYIEKEIKEGIKNDDYSQTRNAQGIALELAAVPLYKIDYILDVMKKYESNHKANYFQSFLLFHIKNLINKYQSNIGISTSIELKEQNETEVVNIYNAWKDLYLEKKLYNLEETPIWPKYR